MMGIVQKTNQPVPEVDVKSLATPQHAIDNGRIFTEVSHNNQFFLSSLWKAYHKLGGKNYMFCSSHSGAKNSAVMYLLFATSKFRGIEPLEWLTKTLTVIPDYPDDQIHKSLPGE